MDLPGSNTMTLCGSALCAIVEKHLADSYYSKDKPVRVNYVRFDSNKFTATFDITTDKNEVAK